MIYEKRLLIPKDTPKSAPVTMVLPLTNGVLRAIEVYFPPGCCGLAHVAIDYWEHQLWPSNTDSDFAADGQSIKFDEDYDLNDDPIELTMRGWNDDDTFPHTITLRVLVKGQEDDITSLLKNLIGAPKVITS